MYKRLNNERKEIRLLSFYHKDHRLSSIECDFQTFELANAPPFDALSYVWGDPKVTAEIQFCGMSKQVTTNLFAALTRLRERNENKWIWIDALCINQNDTIEKNHQVPLMRQIYRSAERVLSWLGEEDGETHLAFSLIERWADAILSTSPSLENWPNGEPIRMAVATIERPFDEQDWSAVRSLFNKSYWERIWILQEVSLARQGILICGRNEIMFHKILWVHRAWVGGDLRLARLEEAINIATYSEQFSDFMTIVRNQIDNQMYSTHEADQEPSACHTLFTFPFLLKRASSLLATDARDKLYGLLGLLNVKTPPIPVDYGKSVVDVYTSAVSLLIQTTRRLDILTFGGIGNINNTARYDLPSWVPDFQRHDLTTQICEHTPFYDTLFFHASAKTNAECSIDSKSRRISIKGILCDEIVAVVAPSSDPGERLRRWLVFTLHHQPSFDARQTSAQQIFFRTIIQDHLWRGVDSPHFLASHLEFEYFQMAAGFMSAMRCIYENKHLQYFDPSNASESRTELDLEVKRTLATWFHDPPWKDEKENYPQATAEVENFLGSPHSRGRLRWPENVLSSSEDDGNKNIVYFRPVFIRSDSRCLFITRRGYMGVGPQSVKAGDEIFLPLGCSVPLIVRTDVKNSKLVGDAYVCGMMQGEVMQNLDGPLPLEEIVLE